MRYQINQNTSKETDLAPQLSTQKKLQKYLLHKISGIKLRRKLASSI